MNKLSNLVLTGTALVIGACQQLPREDQPLSAELGHAARAESSDQHARVRAETGGAGLDTMMEDPSDEPDREAAIYRGEGVFVATPRSRRAVHQVGEITLNFQDTDLHEVIKVILGDLLQENYIIDPTVTGNVTIQSSRPLSKNDLIPTLESLLQMNDAALIYKDGLYKIAPLPGASREALPPSIGREPARVAKGFRTQIVPLRYIAVKELEKLLEPFLEDVLIRTDASRNLLILAGPHRDLDRIIETIEIFDVDWLKGMSVGLIPLDYVESKTVVEELNNLFGKQGESPLTGIVRFVPIERLNAVLVITQQPAYLDRIQDWIGRLDRADGPAGQRLYVYYVQNAKAVDLALVLSSIFGVQPGAERPIEPPELAPGLEPVTIESQERAEERPERPPGPAAPTASDITLPSGSSIRIIADEINNALVILATPQEYRMVEAALRKLDIIPLQVLIEASIIEVSLTGRLEFGVEWFFENNLGSKEGEARFDLGTFGLTQLPGFSYAIIDAESIVRGVVNTLADETTVNFLSTPSLMVLDNQTATINVGDQVPILTQQQQAITAEAPIINSVEYRDTGVLLEVTPRVNAGGLITMEISQEVTDVVTETTGGIDSPTFNQRAIKSTLAVQTGNTVVLGGLIGEDEVNTETGIPGLYKLPIIGKLFGRTTNRSERTELLVLITPRAVRSEDESVKVTEEFKRKLKTLAPIMLPPTE